MKMMMRDIQVLAQIKLNLTSVDQFLAIACGLADDNPSIKSSVYGAAKEARSSALLIDHLRNLFSHQQSIEAQAQTIGQHEQFHQVQAQYQTETSRTFGTNLIHKQQHQQQELNTHLQNQTFSGNQFANPNAGSSGGGGGRFQVDRATFCQNSQLFTYSNQLTLVRASKCLVANVAKILYLTDTIVLRNTDQQQQQLLLQEKLSVNPALSDRLDNVANYSQLLRCFGELSTELVDLGLCIMFSEHHKQWQQQQQNRRPLGQLAGNESEENIGWPQQQQQHQSAEFPDSFGRRNSHQADRHPSSQCQQQYQQNYQQNCYYPQHQMRSSASSTSMLQAAATATTSSHHHHNHHHQAYAGRPRQQQQQQRDSPNGLALEDKSPDETMGSLEGAADWLEVSSNGNNQLATKIQDMQTLFQVNRLIIDRSILLLLSASKCCLRQGDERSRGLEARHSIVVQIRASVSIIMAIVKCSIFGGCNGANPKELPITDGCGGRQQQHHHQHQQQAWPSSTANLFPLVGQSKSVTISTTTNTNFAGVSSSNPRDNQFDNYYYLACLSPFRAPHNSSSNNNNNNNNNNNISNLGGAKVLRPPSESRQANWNSPHGLLNHPAAFVSGADMGSQHRQQQQQLTGGQANKNLQQQQHCVNLNLTSSDNKAGCFQQQICGSLEWPLQIMNYFLQTWNGAQSAHDAISKLQLLVRPFVRVNHYKALFEALNDTIDTFHGIQVANQGAIKSSHEPSRCDRDDHDRVANASYIDSFEATNKENEFTFGGGGGCDDLNLNLNSLVAAATSAAGPQAMLAGSSNLSTSHNSGMKSATNFMLMNKRQLINTLNSMYLGELKANLIERAHEFTDCAYTKHEHRETIVLLIQCIKMQLNKLVKLLYRLRRKAPAIDELHLGQLRQLATQLDETCAELKCELQTIVIEQSDELDKFNSQLELIKQLKHHCLVGDLTKATRVCSEFHEQSEQLVEICKMLNQVSPTNKMKISTKTLAIWFELNMGQLIQVCQCLAQNHRSRVLKDCAYAYIQVWCSFYDDFCQLARQLAYLTHAQCDTDRTLRVASLRDQIIAERQSQPSVNTGSGSLIVNYRRDPDELLSSSYEITCQRQQQHQQQHHQRVPVNHQDGGQDNDDVIVVSGDDDDFDDVDSLMGTAGGGGGVGGPISPMVHAVSVQSLNMADAFDGSTTDSPRSLDHYYGFGANYSRGSRAAHQQQQQQQQHDREPSHLGALSRQSASPRLCCPRGQQDTPPGPQAAYRHPQQRQQMTPNICNPGAIYNQHELQQRHQQQQQQCFMTAGPQEGQRHQTGFHFVDHHQQPAGALPDGSLFSSQQHQPQAVTMDQGGLMGMGLQEIGATPNSNAPYQPPPHSHAGGGGTGSSRRHHHHHHHHRHHHYQQQQQQLQQPGHYVQEQAQMQQQLRQPPAGYHLQQLDGSGEFQLAPLPPPPQKAAPLVAGYGAPVVTVPSRRKGPPLVPVQPLQMPLPAVDDQLASSGADSSTSVGEDQPLEQLAGSNNNGNNISAGNISLDQQSSAGTEPDKWSDSDADAIVRGARETAQMALSMYQFTKGEGDLNTTQDLFTQAELFAEEANELYKEVRCFSYKVPAGDLKKELLAQLGTIPALVQQLQFIVKNPTVGKPATFAKVDSVIRETRSLMEAVNRVVQATLSCRQHYNMAIASMRKRTRTLSPSYRGDKGFEFENHSSARQSAIGGRHGSGGGGMGSEPDI